VEKAVRCTIGFLLGPIMKGPHLLGRHLLLLLPVLLMYNTGAAFVIHISVQENHRSRCCWIITMLMNVPLLLDLILATGFITMIHHHMDDHNLIPSLLATGAIIMRGLRILLQIIIVTIGIKVRDPDLDQGNDMILLVEEVWIVITTRHQNVHNN